MAVFIQLLTILGMVGITFLLFQSFGMRRQSLLFTKEEKAKWDTLIQGNFGSWSAITNVVGTMTSLATVYVFFIGSSKLFGWVTLWCSVSIWASSIITNSFTRRICSGKHVSKLLESTDQAGGVIATIFWRESRKAQQTAFLAKWISLITIVAIVWLDFAIFADIAAQITNHTEIVWKLGILVFCSFTVTLFTLRYGLRGFVFADLFQSPLIFLGGISLLVGCSILVFSGGPTYHVTMAAFFQPILPAKDCALFALQVASLNLLLILVSESHWLRIWIFREKETTLQVKSTAVTAALWGILTIVGLFAFTSSGQQLGVPAIGIFLNRLAGISVLFIVAFWIGAMAALFASADSQIYAFLLVCAFNPRTGQLDNTQTSRIKPLQYSIASTSLFVLIYCARTCFNLPFEKMIFLALPICLNIFPALVLAARRVQQQPILVWVSLFLYVACAVLAFCQPRNEFAWTLSAPLMPVAMGLLAWLLPIEAENEE